MTNMISADNSAVLAAKNIAVGELSAAVAGPAVAAAQGGKQGLSAAVGDNDRLTAILESLSRSSAETAKALSAVSSRLGNQRGCGCCGCCACCCGGGNAAVSSCDTVYTVMGDTKYAGGNYILNLVSYHQPITSQAEADAVNVIVFLGGTGGDPISFNTAFTLDGFAMPGNLQIDFLTLNSYPCTLLRKQDRSGWICLNRQDMVHMDWNLVSVYVDGGMIGKAENIEELLCCGLYQHNCRGKVFTVVIPDGENWTEEQKSLTAYFTVKKDTIYYDTFPGESAQELMYREICVTKDYESGSSNWGELIKKYGNKPFGVRIPADGMFLATAFAIN